MWTKSFADVDRFTAIMLLTMLVCVGIAGAVMARAHFCALSVGCIGDSTVTYSVDNNETGAWTRTLTLSSPSAAWYSRFEINTCDYSGPITITWQLQQKTGDSTWTDVGGSTSTSIVLLGIAQNVYATSNGAYAAGNHDWRIDVRAAGTYRVVVIVEST